MHTIKQTGKGLIELLVAIAIGLIILTTVLAIYVTTSKTTKASTIEAEMNEDGALALNILQQQLKLAGFSNYTNSATSGKNFQGTAVFGCTKGFSSTSVAFDSLACKTDGEAAFAIRYEADTINTFQTGTGAAARPTNCSFQSISNATQSDADATKNYYLADNRYYIKEDSENGGRKTLFCRGMNGASHTDETALVANVEDMVITYAIRGPEVDGKPSQQIVGYVSANDNKLGTTKKNWQDRVIGINICLLMSTQNTVSADGGTKKYKDCTGAEQTSSDRKLRRSYTTTIMFRNLLKLPKEKE